MLTTNLHAPLIRECGRTGKQYDADNPFNDTCSYLSDYGDEDKRFTWNTHRHTDGSVCEWMEEEDLVEDE